MNTLVLIVLIIAATFVAVAAIAAYASIKGASKVATMFTEEPQRRRR